MNILPFFSLLYASAAVASDAGLMMLLPTVFYVIYGVSFP